MKKNLLLLLVLALVGLLTSCNSLQVKEQPNKYKMPESFEIPDMEYIGVKAPQIMSPSTGMIGFGMQPSRDLQIWQNISGRDTLGKFGSILQRSGIAVDESYAYFGIYSFQELANFKNVKRYITFIEVSKFHFDIKENSWGKIYGGTILCSFGLFAIGIPVLCVPSTTKLRMDAVFNIYVYDTKTQTIRYQDAINLNRLDKFKGRFKEDETLNAPVYEFYETVVTNALLEKYSQVRQLVLSWD